MVTQMSEPWGLMRGCDILKSKTRRLSLFILPQTSSDSLQLSWSSDREEREGQGEVCLLRTISAAKKTGKGRRVGDALD